MKPVVKTVLLATTLMLAQPAFAHDGKEGHHHRNHKERAADRAERRDARNDAYNTDRREDRTDRRYDRRDGRRSTYMGNRNTTFAGYPVQSTRNPGEVRDEMRRVRSSH